MSWAWAPGTWGELLQGESGGRRFLVSLPSARGAQTSVKIRPRLAGEQPVVGGQKKARTAVSRLLELLDEQGVQVHLSTSTGLQTGVGHASSSADILSALRATCRALSAPLSSSTLCWLAAQVEPTNPTLLGGACLFEPDSGRLLGQAPLPAMRIQPIACGGAVDTVRAREQRPAWTGAQRREMARVLESARTALGTGDLVLLARASTRSALIHAERSGRQDIHEALQTARRLNALGIAVSHSGSSIVALHRPSTRKSADV